MPSFIKSIKSIGISEKGFRLTSAFVNERFSKEIDEFILAELQPLNVQQIVNPEFPWMSKKIERLEKALDEVCELRKEFKYLKELAGIAVSNDQKNTILAIMKRLLDQNFSNRLTRRLRKLDMMHEGLVSSLKESKPGTFEIKSMYNILPTVAEIIPEEQYEKSISISRRPSFSWDTHNFSAQVYFMFFISQADNTAIISWGQNIVKLAGRGYIEVWKDLDASPKFVDVIETWMS